jgi:hypothetical protein
MPILDSETKQSTPLGSAGPTKEPEKSGETWDSLRGLTKGAQKQRRAGNIRTALLALLLILTFAFMGWVLHDHLPALVSFGKEVGNTVAEFTSQTPKPSEPARSIAVQDQRRAQKKPHSKRAKVRSTDSRLDAAYDPPLHPFYATALIDGRRVFLTSNDTVIVLDIASGRWTTESESP